MKYRRIIAKNEPAHYNSEEVFFLMSRHFTERPKPGDHESQLIAKADIRGEREIL